MKRMKESIYLPNKFFEIIFSIPLRSMLRDTKLGQAGLAHFKIIEPSRCAFGIIF